MTTEREENVCGVYIMMHPYTFYCFLLSETVEASSTTRAASSQTPLPAAFSSLHRPTCHLQQHEGEAALPGRPVRFPALQGDSAPSTRFSTSSSSATITHLSAYPGATAHGCSISGWVSIASQSRCIFTSCHLVTH